MNFKFINLDKTDSWFHKQAKASKLYKKRKNDKVFIIWSCCVLKNIYKSKSIHTRFKWKEMEKYQVNGEEYLTKTMINQVVWIWQYQESETNKCRKSRRQKLNQNNLGFLALPNTYLPVSNRTFYLSFVLVKHLLLGKLYNLCFFYISLSSLAN